MSLICNEMRDQPCIPRGLHGVMIGGEGDDW